MDPDIEEAEWSFAEGCNPHPRQVEFLKAIYKHRFVLYGGARGGGKSYILRWGLLHFLMWCTSHGLKSVRVGLFCITYNELWNRQIVKILTEFPAWLGKYNGEHEEWRFHEQYGGHVIQFCNMDKLTSYQSAEFAAVAVDEITLCPDREVLDFLKGSLRWPGLKWTPFFAATNPNGPGHSWVKRLWITKDFTDKQDARLDASQFHFIRSLPRDNPNLTEEYIQENLESLPDHLREPWLNGSWDIVEGQRFPTFREHVHTLRPIDLKERYGNVEYFRAVDYGTFDPMCCGWYATVKVGPQWEGDKGVRFFKVKEWIETGLSGRLQAMRIREQTPADWHCYPTILDTQAWGEYEEGLSIADKFMQELGSNTVIQALKDRVAGWEAMDNLLEWVPGKHDDGSVDYTQVIREPILRFFDTCHITISQVRDAMWDPRKGYDIIETRKGGQHQDALHETRYACLTHMRPPQSVAKPDAFDYDRRVWAAMQSTKNRSRSARNRALRALGGG